MIKLPDKPSEIMRLALADLRSCKSDDTYKINMGTWHTPLLNGRCSVCLAGAVMAKTLKADPWMPLTPGSYDEITKIKMLFLDSIRNHCVSHTWIRKFCQEADTSRLLEVEEFAERLLEVDTDNYSWAGDTHKIADKFEEVGL